MKTTITIISLSAILACLTLSAQETQPAAGGGLADRFKQLDRNGDGKLTVEELGAEWLRKLDTNGDGTATLEEATGSFGSSAQAPAAVAQPDFSGNWALDAKASTGPAQMLAFEAKAKYRITQDGKLLSFHRSDSNLTVNYPLDGTEGTAEFRSAASRKASVSGRWLPDGKTLELKTVFQAEDGSPSAFSITEQMVLSPDKRTITLRRSTTGGRQIQDQTLVYRRVEADVPPAQPSVTRDAASSETVVSSLTKPSLEVCLSAGSAEQATKFFAEGIGLVARGEPRSGASGAALRMLLFSAGSSTVKVRVYSAAARETAGRHRRPQRPAVLTIPVEKLDAVVAAEAARLRMQRT